MNRSNQKVRSAMTLLELLMVMALLAILGEIFVAMNVAGTRVFQSELTKSSLRGDATTALDRMRIMLREVRALDQIASRSLTVWQDQNVNSSREVDEVIQFSWSGTPGDPLLKVVNNQSVPYLANVQSFTATYDATSKVFQLDVTARQGAVDQTYTVKAQARNL